MRIGSLAFAVAIAGCAGVPAVRHPSTPPVVAGVLTGTTWVCTLYAGTHSSAVFVYRNERLVAERRFPRGGATYRFVLPPGEYSVRFSSPSAESFPVVVNLGETTHGPESRCQ